MKRIIALIVILSIVFCGCGIKDSTVTESSTDVSDTPDSGISYIGAHNRFNYLTVSNQEYIYIANAFSMYRTDKTTGEDNCIYTNDKYILKILLANNDVYFFDAEQLYKLNTEDGTAMKIADMTDDDNRAVWTDAYSIGGKIYLYSYMTNKNALIEEMDSGTYINETPEDVKNIFVTDDNVTYKYIKSSDFGDGIIVNESGETICGKNNKIKGVDSFIISDDCIFYCSGSMSDFESGTTMYRKNLADGTEEKIKNFGSEIIFDTYDSEYIYFHDYINHYRIDKLTLEVFASPVKYDSNKLTEICNGEIYRVQSLDPVKINFETGELNKICK